MSRRLLLLTWLLGLALCGGAQAAAPVRIELSATPAWKGWSRPGRSTEIDLRLSADRATRATLELQAGSQSLRTELDLQPGRPVRLQLPVRAAETLTVSARPAEGAPQRRELGLSLAESPMLGVGLASGEAIAFEGFHSLALTADDLPRNASAWSSIDALILDAPTLGALDARQLAALLSHASGCGRIVLINTDARVRRTLDAAGGCGGRSLLHAATLDEARRLLESSLAASLPAAMSPGGLAELAAPSRAVWQRVAVGLAVYFAAAALAIVFVSSWPVLLAAPALTAAMALALLHAVQPASQLVVWSEGDSGAQLAGYQAWQQWTGRLRERVRVPIPPQLAPSARPCATSPAVHFELDAGRAQATEAEFETRLFRQVSLCYGGSFPIARAITSTALGDGARQVRNAGSTAWPAGWLLAAGQAQVLPALGPGAELRLDARAGRPGAQAALRTALARTPADAVAALWPLDLGGVAGVPADARGWLRVSAPTP